MCKKSLLMMLLLAIIAPWAANAQTSLFSEDFEGGSMPAGWTTDGSGSWSVGVGDYSTTTGAGQGSYNALITHGTTGNVTKLITPEIDLSSVTSATLSFMHVQRSWAGDIDYLKVYYRTSSSETWTQLVAYTSAISSWTTEEDIVLPNTTATYQLAFEHTDNYGYGVGIDQVIISTPPAFPKPTGLTVSNVTHNSATLSWNENGPATAWQIGYTANGETEQYVSVTENPYTLTGLTPLTTYEVRVQSDYQDNTYSEFSNPVSFTTEVACPAPTGLAAALTPGNGSVATLSWTSDASAWVVAYKTADATDFTEVNVTENPYTLTSLTPETTYNAKVKAVCGGEDGESSWSNTITFTPTNAYQITVNDGTTTNAYVPFYGYYADSDANSQFIIPADGLSDMAWGTIQKLTFYSSAASAVWNGAVFDIYFSEVDYTTFETAALIDWTALSEKVYTGSVSVENGKMELTLTSPYIYMGGNLLIGFDETSNSSNYPSAPWYGVTQTNNTAVYKYSSNSAVLAKFLPKVAFGYTPGEEPACMWPTNLAVSNVTAHTAELSWTSDGTAWQIGYSTDGFVTEQYVEVTENPYTLTGLDPETDYEVRVQKNCGGGTYSQFCTPVSFTTAVACTAPTGLATSNLTGHGATITWTAEEGAWYQSALVKTAEYDANNITWSESFEGNSQTWNNLDPETGYTFALRKDCGSEDGYSTVVTRTFTTDVACPAPTGLAAALTPGNGSVATLSWTSDASAWVVAYKTADATDFTEVNVTENPYTLTSLTPETTYNAKVKAVCGGEDGESSWSNTITFTPTDAYTLTVNDGTTTNGYVPIYGYYVDDITKSQFIIPAENLADMAWGTINKMTFYAAADKNWGAAQFEVYMTETSETTLSALADYGTMTKVKNAGSLSISGNVMVVELDAPYQYMGGNLMIGFLQTVTGTYSSCSWYGVSAEGASMGGNGSSINQQNFLPKTTFDYEPGEEPACMWPTNLAVSNVTAHTAELSWTSDGTAWQIGYSTDGFVTEQYVEITENPYTLTGLDPETDYEVRVQKNCGGGTYSVFCTPVSFTTEVACPAPTGFAASNITAHTADLAWTGFSESYTVQYRTAAYMDGIEEGFGTSSLPTGWTRYTGLVDNVMAGTATLDSVTSGWSFDTNNGVFDNHARTNIYGASWNKWLVTPSIEVSGHLSFDLALTAYGGTLAAPQTTGTDDRFIVLVSTDEKATWTILREWNNSGSDYVYNDITCSATGESVTIDLSSYMGQTVYIAFYGESTINNADNNLHIDNVTCGTPVPAGQWQTVTVDEAPVILTGLTPETTYEATVQGDCGEDGESEWATTVFTTDKAYYWNNPETWPNDSVPEANANVTIPANTQVIIPSGYTAYADTITFGEGASILIENGGQLYHSNEVPVTMQLAYDPNNYTSSKDGETEYGEYRLIAAPVNPGVPVSSTGLVPESTDPNYDYVDLYYFDQNVGELVWINYKYEANNFDSLFIKKGYLYSNAQNVLGIFGGNTLPTSVDVKEPLEYNPDSLWAGWNLVGNPFTCMAFVNRPYYKINGDGDAIAQAEGNSLEVFEGVFVLAEQADDTVTFFTLGPTGSDPGVPEPDPEMLTLNLNDGRSLIDRAIVRFDEGRQLLKLQMGSSTKVYIPKDGSDYAIVSSDDTGEMPVSFKAENDGTYTMNFSSENINFSYLHLIDNKTGDDIDLLETPSYTFTARTNDYTNRFKLVFALGTTGIEESFAFFNNGNLVISNEGNATLQVVDVMGRILKSENINGSASVKVDAAPGVYMIRLTNGSNVKVQKVVVE